MFYDNSRFVFLAIIFSFYGDFLSSNFLSSFLAFYSFKIFSAAFFAYVMAAASAGWEEFYSFVSVFLLSPGYNWSYETARTFKASFLSASFSASPSPPPNSA